MHKKGIPQLFTLIRIYQDNENNLKYPLILFLLRKELN
jgi:hypothetical protein